MKVLLVNPNLLVPPVAPLALDLLAGALLAAGFEPLLLDLAWSGDVARDIAALDGREFLFAGVTIRNTDDSTFPGTDAILASHRRVVGLLKSSGFRVVVGGAGFSIAPQETLSVLGADHALAGDGEEAVVALARALARGGPLGSVPGLVGASGLACASLSEEAPLRAFVDNGRYFRHGGQVGFETQRGCPFQCAVCPEPVTRGRGLRLRPPGAVGAELSRLLAQGIDVLHTCDSEFNASRTHALAVSRELSGAGLGERLRWYAYCAPAGFDRELAQEMKRAGCVGINFAAMHGDPAMLAALACPHGVEDLRRVARVCRETGIRFMFDLLLGAPGESRASISAALDLMRELEPTRVGVGLGVRLYDVCDVIRGMDLGPANPAIHRKGPDGRLVWPTYHVEARLGPDVADWIGERIDGDRRFFFGATTHNYRDRDDLGALIAAGARGAYWDILARASGD